MKIFYFNKYIITGFCFLCVFALLFSYQSYSKTKVYENKFTSFISLLDDPMQKAFSSYDFLSFQKSFDQKYKVDAHFKKQIEDLKKEEAITFFDLKDLFDYYYSDIASFLLLPNYNLIMNLPKKQLLDFFYKKPLSSTNILGKKLSMFENFDNLSIQKNLYYSVFIPKLSKNLFNFLVLLYEADTAEFFVRKDYKWTTSMIEKNIFNHTSFSEKWQNFLKKTSLENISTLEVVELYAYYLKDLDKNFTSKTILAVINYTENEKKDMK